MIRRRQWMGAVGAAAVVAIGGGAHAQVADLADAINKAGRQRMLSQRMGKAYLALVQGVETQLAQQVLDKSMALFDRQLVELKSFARSGDLRGTYVALEAAWSDYKTALVGSAPSRAGAAPVLAGAARVLALAQAGTVQFEALSNKPVGKLVNLAGRQRMLSQRMAKSYLAAVLPVDVAASRQDLASARQEFVAAVEVLRSAPEANSKIKEQLALGDAQWLLFDHALQKTAAAGNLKPLADVFVASENLLEVMDHVTGLYAELKA
ncbi:MAG TPA: type IV pili methyl-accepting chemotaxis transducer N-terminal domain-containing protein [Ramlibacter sp.]|nr:type IV pili methyl-accepting chemotaxis transducer N-terminal domain-containing protein [Ramlibacter sp.]